MAILFLFLFILVGVFVVVVMLTQPTRSEKLAQSRIQSVAGRARADAAQRVDILRHDSYSNIPWLNHLFGRLTPAARLRRLTVEADINWSVGQLVLGSIIALFVVYWVVGLFGLNRILASFSALLAFL